MFRPTQTQREWLVQRSRAMYEVLNVPFIDDEYRSYITGLHTGLAVGAFKEEFGVEVTPSDMHSCLLMEWPAAVDPTYGFRVMERFLRGTPLAVKPEVWRWLRKRVAPLRDSQYRRRDGEDFSLALMRIADEVAREFPNDPRLETLVSLVLANPTLGAEHDEVAP